MRIAKNLSLILLGFFVNIGCFADAFQSFPYVDDWTLRVVRTLNLSNEQKKRIDKISQSSEEDIKKYHAEFIEIQSQINNGFKNNTFDDKQIDEWINEQLKMYGHVLNIRLKTRANIYQILTPEQQKIFTKKVEEWIQSHN